jgi:phosphatidylglycerophosphate synthase
LRNDLLREHAAVLAAVAVVAIALERALPLDPLYAAKAIAVAAAGGALTFALASRYLDGAFGAANRITLVRGGLVALLLGLVADGAAPWAAVALGGLALTLDGVDGWLARRFGSASPFGARFDMETDAILILALCALCWQFDKAGAWVLAAGLLRYLFVAAAWPLPWMRRPLPASRRRQTVCVVQIIALLACLSPLFPRPWSVAVAAVGLSVLVWSFLIDVVWLARRA